MSGAHLLPMWDCTQSLPILGIENKTVRAWLPKTDKQACGWPETKSSPTYIIRALTLGVLNYQKCYISIPNTKKTCFIPYAKSKYIWHLFYFLGGKRYFFSVWNGNIAFLVIEHQIHYRNSKHQKTPNTKSKRLPFQGKVLHLKKQPVDS